GTNVANTVENTVKNGTAEIVSLVEAAQHRLNAARNAVKANKVLNDAFARYFVTLQMELDALRANPEPPTSNGMPLVTRELVSAELAASAVYVFQWHEIQQLGKIASIVPVEYPPN